MTREDAQALLDLARLDCSPPPSVDREGMMRRYVEMISQQREKGRSAAATNPRR